MLSIPLAAQLCEAGLRWTPTAGDRFTLMTAGMHGEIFVISDMTVDVHELPGGRVIGFNGTTEWALDSVEQAETLWIPREDQLRVLLGATFVSLTHTGLQWTVTTQRAGMTHQASSADPEDAYGAALLNLMDDL